MRESKKLIIILAGIGILLAGTVYGITRGEEKIVDNNGVDMLEEVAIPPIDLASPSDTQVATFALG